MNVFMTGGTGFLGQVVINRLVQKNHDIYVLVRSEQKANDLLAKMEPQYRSHIHFVYGDITSPLCGVDDSHIQQLQQQIDVVYHMAALVKFDEELHEELHEINYTGTDHTLQLAKEIRAKRFYYVSTAYTLGKQEVGKEELYPTQIQFNNPYERSKCLAEHLVYSYRHDMDVAIFRPAIIIGDSESGKADSLFTLYGFIRGLELFKKKISRKPGWRDEEYRIIGHEEGNSNFVPVDYVANVLIAAIEYAQKDHIYHITNQNAPTNGDILSLIKELLDFRNLSILPPKKMQLLSADESRLNSLVECYKAYLDRTINFYDHNTQKLLQKANVMGLTMDQDMLRRIIYGYKQS